MLAAKGSYPIEIPRSTWSVIGLLSGFVAFAVGGIVLLLVPDQTPYLPAYIPRFGLSDDTLRDILTWGCLVFFGGGGLFVAIRLAMTPRVAARVTETGFSLGALLSEEIPWSGVPLTLSGVPARRLFETLRDAHSAYRSKSYVTD